MTPSDLKTAEELSYMTQNNPPTMLAYTMLVQESFLSLYYSMFKFFLLDIYGSHRLKLRTTRFILNHHTLSE